MKLTVKDLTLIALFAALTAVLNPLAFQFPAMQVPYNLALVSVLIAGGLLNPLPSALSQTVFLLIGIAGLPVFAKFNSGAGYLAGPTGGFLIGYILAAFIISVILHRTGRGVLINCVAMLAGLIFIYLFGTIWFMSSTKNGLFPTLTFCVYPFIVFDLVKIGVSAFVVSKLHKIVNKRSFI